MSAWLDPLRAALDASAAPLAFFIRDDDAGRADAKLELLLDLIETLDAPIDVAAIPAQLTPAYAGTLLRRRERCQRLRIHQHGYAHINHEAEGRKCEFGPSRDALRQQGDIRHGKDRLLALLGPTDPIFTPPWNRCTQDTVAALTREGFRVLSREANAAPLKFGSLHHLPVSVDWRRRRGERRETPHDAAMAMAAQIRGGATVLGLMLHHEVLDEDDHLALQALLRLLGAHPRVARMNMITILEKLDASLLAI